MTINPTALKLLKWIRQTSPSKAEDYHQWRAKTFWDKYGEKAIKKAINHSACVNIGEFIRLADYYNKNQ